MYREDKKMYEIKLDIDGMACGMCESHINDAIRRQLRVKKVRSSYRKGSTLIIAEEEISREEIERALEGTGYIVENYEITEK